MDISIKNLVKKFLIIFPGIFEKYTQGKLEWRARVYFNSKKILKKWVQNSLENISVLL